MQLQVIEQQVDFVVVAVYHNPVLPPNVGKASSQFEQKLGHVVDKAVFQFAFIVPLRESKKIKVVGIAEQLLGKVAFRFRQRSGKVTDGLPLAQV